MSAPSYFHPGVLITRDQFSGFVRAELAGLPDEFKASLPTTTIEVNYGEGPEGVYGSYQGTPVDERKGGEDPSTVRIYAYTIVDRNQEEDQVKRKLHDVLTHELTHHLGLRHEEM